MWYCGNVDQHMVENGYILMIISKVCMLWTLVCSSIHSSIHSLVHSSIHPFIHPFIHSLEHLEIGYISSHMDWQFTIFPHQFQVSFSISKLMNISTQELYEIRRLAFSPLMPLLVRWVINYIYWNSYLIDLYRRRLISSHWFIQTDSYLIIQTETHTYSLIYVYRLRLMPIHWFIQIYFCL